MDSDGTIQHIAGLVYNFSETINPKVNVMARLDFELVSPDVAV